MIINLGTKHTLNYCVAEW